MANAKIVEENGAPGYPLSAKCSCQIPLFINFPSGTRPCIPDFHRGQDRLDRPRIRENMRLNMLLRDCRIFVEEMMLERGRENKITYGEFCGEKSNLRNSVLLQ